MPELAVDRVLAVLQRHEVRYVLIGGLAAQVRGSAYNTNDIDITPDRAHENLAKLSAALRDLNARVRSPDVPEGLPFDHDAASLARADVSNLTTDAGDLDISFVPTGTQGFEDLVRDAGTVEITGVPVLVASLADVVRSKQAAGRPKDLLVLPALRRLLDEGPPT